MSTSATIRRCSTRWRQPACTIWRRCRTPRGSGGSGPQRQWTPAVIKEGAKGPLAAEFAFVRAVAVRDALPGPAVWVVLRRRGGETPELKTYLSNAPAAMPAATLVWVSGMRWPVESAILECKSELGMDHYEVRGWVGWHHHLAL